MTDDKLRECVAWYIRHHGRKETDVTVFETFVCGHFRTFPREAREIRRELQDLGLVSVSDGKVVIL